MQEGDDLENCAFTGNGAFESLIEKYTEVADGKNGAQDLELGSKGKCLCSSVKL